MHRPRLRLRLLAVAVAVVAAAAFPSISAEPGAAEGAEPRLNVVLILTDDERADIERVPSVQRLLAQEGVTFTNAFATTPACCPARAGILTGQYAHTNGVVANSGWSSYPAFDESTNLAVWLQDAGYETALVGKYMNGYGVYGEHRIPPGWSDWQVIDSAPWQRYYEYVLNENGLLVGYGSSPQDYSTTVLTQKAVEFIDESKRPFFLYFAPLAPHLPATPPPASRRVGELPPFERGPAFNERDVRDKPWRASVHSRPLRPGAERYVENSIRKRQLRSLSAVDDSVEQIVAALERRGVLDRTVIIYASDNGFLWGEHRLGGKMWPYEESIRIPLVVRTPWRAQRGRTDPRLVLNIDLASTITQLAGTTPALPQDGRSLVPLLQGAKPVWRNSFVVEYLGGNLLRHGGPPPYRALRTKRYMYVEYLNGWRELYDLALDPWQLENRARDASQRSTRQVLARRLETLFSTPPR